MYVRAPLAVVDPFGGGQALVKRRHVEKAGIDVQGVQQVACGADHSGGEGGGKVITLGEKGEER